ncbi:hypothetical protein ACFV2Z_22765 [Streptomyces sp. NPDC059688]|uniref:hypothetical protein n=1 Tax=unclassified Streptomyces TaxID=2593676 RepID=UPI00093E1F1D|nr:hypothetical protein [Streptomyces sp. CB01883]OKJ79283.1 hypothetical protein AMK32_31340 [Streptomyces sp. CB01883]
MNSKLRIAAATVTAALALGVAAPMANAVEASRTPAVSAVQVEAAASPAQMHAIAAALTSRQGETVTAKGAVDPALLETAKDIVAYIKKYLAKEYTKARNAAKKGYAAFVKWVKSLKPENPVRIVLEIGGKKLIEIVITLLKK